MFQFQVKEKLENAAWFWFASLILPPRCLFLRILTVLRNIGQIIYTLFPDWESLVIFSWLGWVVHLPHQAVPWHPYNVIGGVNVYHLVEVSGFCTVSLLLLNFCTLFFENESLYPAHAQWGRNGTLSSKGKYICVHYVFTEAMPFLL